MFARRLAASGFIGFATLFLILAAGIPTSIDRTIEHSRRIDLDFKATAVAVDSFERRNHRLPSDEEVTQLLPNIDAIRHRAFELSDRGFNQCDNRTKEFERFKGGYVIAMWRGQWWECYAPSTGMSTLALSPMDFPAELILAVLFAGLSLWSAYAGVKRWRGAGK